MNRIFEKNFFNSFQEGIHLYINIMNIERLISIDEKDDDMNHVFSLLNTFVYSIEDYICSNYKSNATFEKLTGGRIHLIISGKQANIALSICDYAISLTKEIVGFRQYQSIASVKLQFGLDFGKYVDFLFSDDGTDYEEYTSIGSVANYACKLQVHANANEVLISSDVFSLLNDTIKSEFVLIDTDRQTVLNKYNQNQLVYSKLLLPKQGIGLFNSYIDRARTYSANHALKSMNTIRPNVLNFSNWSINNNAKFDALIVFADVRGFTKKFNSNDSNLSELSEKTKRILSSMYNTCQNEEGVHIQFQGDREFVFFKESEFDKAVIYALKTVGSIKNIGECIGVGIEFGKVYATNVGRNSELYDLTKQPVLIGDTVNRANHYENDCADKNEIVISPAVFNHLADRSLKELFKKRDNYYVTGCDYNDFFSRVNNRIEEENHDRDYRKPWCDD